MKTIVVIGDRTNEWLYYETGFEQLHPIPDIIQWMEEQGWEYQRDWFCKKNFTKMLSYTLTFPTAEVATTFLLRWS